MVPSHSIVTSYGHVLKAENDEKQSNTLGPTSEHCLEATAVLHSQQVNYITELCGLKIRKEIEKFNTKWDMKCSDISK